jgi:anti-sigma regulatory factor (Ser/Thr protein kinase)
MTADHPAGQAAPGHAAREDGQEDGMPAGPAALDQAFDPSSLYQLRAAVAAHASAAGLGPPRVYDVVTTAHELAANAVRHGAGYGRLRLHSDGQALYCQVSDDGPASCNGNNGQRPARVPPWPVEYAHGLWVIGKIADEFSIDHGPAGTTATACFTISPSPPAGEGGDGTMTPEDQGSPRR